MLSSLVKNVCFRRRGQPRTLSIFKLPLSSFSACPLWSLLPSTHAHHDGGEGLIGSGYYGYYEYMDAPFDKGEREEGNDSSQQPRSL